MCLCTIQLPAVAWSIYTTALMKKFILTLSMPLNCLRLYDFQGVYSTGISMDGQH